MINFHDPITQSVYEYVELCCGVNHFPPTLQEIATHCNIGKQTAYRHLSKLEAKGLIQIKERTARGIILLPIPS